MKTCNNGKSRTVWLLCQTPRNAIFKENRIIEVFDDRRDAKLACTVMNFLHPGNHEYIVKRRETDK